MKNWKSLLLIFILSQVSCSNRQENQIKRIDGSSIGESQLDEKIKILKDKANVTGIAVTVFNNDEVAYQKAFGYSNNETKDTLDVNHIIYGASFSKAVYGYLISTLVHEDIIDLDKELYKYLDVDLPDLYIEKEFRRLHDLKEDDRYKQITTRMCLSHTTGFSNWRWLTEPDEKLRIHFTPGTNYSYSGEGMVLSQWIVEHVTGRTLEDLAIDRIFDPLKMKNSNYLWREDFKEHFCYGHNVNEKKLPKDIETEDANAAGSLSTTVSDYSKFLVHILKLHSKDSEITKTMFNPNIRIKSKAQFGPLAKETTDENDEIELSYGLGWGLLKSDYGIGAFKEGHSEGFQHYSILFPEKNIGVLIMSNSDNGESIFKELLELTIGDIYTPWKWENYIPNNQKE